MKIDPSPIPVHGGQDIADAIQDLVARGLAVQDGTVQGLPLYRLNAIEAVKVVTEVLMMMSVELNAYTHSPEAKALQAGCADFLGKLSAFVNQLPAAPGGSA